jgi:histidinol-phosphatase (PHP family)
MADVIRKTGADIIGHFDLVTKFIEVGAPIDTAHPRYIRAWKSAADALIRTGKPFEINTGAISRGYRNAPYPASDILHYIAKNGGRAILSSDTHAKENFAFRFDEAAALARETGIHLCTLSEALPGREF